MGCTTSGKVITYPHAQANFPHYKTYKIVSHEKIAEVSPRGYATYQRLDELISQELEQKGYRYHLQADLILKYEISSSLSQNTRRSTYNRYDWYFPDSQYWERNNQQAEVLLEVVLDDTSTKKPAWTGNADITLRRRDIAEDKIKSKLVEILAELPATTGQ